MRKPIYALLFVSALGCNNGKVEQPSPKPPVKPVATATTEPSTKAASAPAALVANPPATSKEKQLLFDPRLALVKTEIPKDTQEALLQKLFPKRLKDMKECKNPNDGSKTSEEDIAAGQIVPSILSSATGAFTAPGLTQSAYVVDVGECHAEMTRDTPETSSILVVVSGEEIKLNQKDFGQWQHLRALDLDQDGLQDLVAINEYEGMDASKYLQLYKFNGKEFQSIEKFIPDSMVYTDTCYIATMSEGAEEGSISLSVVSFTPTAPGKLPTFSEEKFVATCKKGAPFTPAP